MQRSWVSGARAHVAETLRWSAGVEVPLIEVVAAAVGMAAPVAVGAATGHLAVGLAAALGGLALGDVSASPSAATHARGLVAGFLPVAAAAVVATLIAGHGWITDALLLVAAATASVAGGFSRALAVSAMRFVLCLTLTISASEAAAATAEQGGLLVVILAGAVTAAVVSLALGRLPGRHRRAVPPADAAGAGARATAAQKYRRWKRTLAHRAGWQYPLRLCGCFAIAAIARHAWPAHHLHWIALVVAILTQRQLEPLPVRTTQRALGTVLGVVAAGGFVAYRPSAWVLVLGIGVLAGVRPLLKVRSYVAYTAAMTPLILLLLSASHPLGVGILIDRLVATLLGAGLVIGANVAAARWLSVTEPT